MSKISLFVSTDFFVSIRFGFSDPDILLRVEKDINSGKKGISMRDKRENAST